MDVAAVGDVSPEKTVRPGGVPLGIVDIPLQEVGVHVLGKMLTGLVQLLQQLPVAVGSAFGVVDGSGSNLPAKRLCPHIALSGLVGKVVDLHLYGSCLSAPEDTASHEV